MTKTNEAITCPECGKRIEAKGYIQECDYCLSKKSE
ncbi:DNA-directed RNA polymerase subunit RPC12/RpoP [Virgibacillus halotolerans]|nr:YhfH family protein [Virgibacillus halotolerans]MBM7600631.1 DNA-directed RNA polymerase subunit RPC12/RpoP [Virgibacillus halotolerans]